MNISKVSMASNSNVAQLDKRDRKPVSQASFSGTQTPLSGISNQQLASALRASLGNISFRGQAEPGSLLRSFHQAIAPVMVCGSENVGSKIAADLIIGQYAPFIPGFEDAIKTTIPLTDLDKKSGKATYARTQVKRGEGGKVFLEMRVREPHAPRDLSKQHSNKQDIQIHMLPDDGRNYLEKVDIMNTKGALTAVLRNNGDVILTNDGVIKKRSGDPLEISATKGGAEAPSFEPFTPVRPTKVDDYTTGPSIGDGGEVVIGMEDGRFNKEIVHSIETFEKKIRNGEIVLPQFKAAEGAKNIQMAMLAGGFGSRAEYTNASSAGIIDGEKDGAQSTKGIFRTPTGLTPMETTFVSLHMAGLLDCSKENFGIGKNVRFYLNQSGVNKGNGGFTVDMYKKTIGSDHVGEFILPNDSISRMPKAIAEAARMMNTGDTAIAMIAKKVPASEAAGTFGIMQLDENNQILEFAEKPKVIPEGYADENGNCLTNTFQFVVSKEAFKALDLIEPYFSSALQGKETRDWSKQLVPAIMVLTRFDDPEDMKKNLPVVAGITKLSEAEQKEYINFLEEVPDEVLLEAKEILKGQKVYSVPTDESWVDAGQLDAMYNVITNIAKGKFDLLPFERNNTINCINPRTGLVAMTPDQKAAIEEKYDIKGRVMVVPAAERAPDGILTKYEKHITINERQSRAV